MAEQRVEEQFRDLIGAVREHLYWQLECGATGLPVDPHPPAPAVLPEPVPEPLVAAPMPPPAAVVPRAPSPAAPGPESIRTVALDAPSSPGSLRPASTRVRLPLDQRLQILASLDQEAHGCTRCVLHEQRKNVAFARGNPMAELMIVGEGPGADEDAQGVPFVGKAGQLLDKMIAAMGYGRDEVYIANVVKCRPPKNRTPEPDEMQTCMPYLRRQIEVVAPKVIVAMGATAVRGLLGSSEGITRMRGKWKLYQAAIPVMPTFHPAYLLRQESAKRDVWNDLKEVLKHLGRPVPAPRR